MQACRGAENVQTRERGSGGNFGRSKEILINLKTENKWKFQITGKHQNKQIETWKEKMKHGKGKKKSERKKCSQNFILPIGGKREILELIFNAINCLMKHYNLSCQFQGTSGLEKDMQGGNFQGLNIFCTPGDLYLPLCLFVLGSYW